LAFKKHCSNKMSKQSTQWMNKAGG
jgi:hypothetical protein